MAERRRDNIARRCWRLVYPDGSSARVGLFVGAAEALEYARENHWTVLHEEPEEATPEAVGEQVDHAPTSATSPRK